MERAIIINFAIDYMQLQSSSKCPAFFELGNLSSILIQPNDAP